MANFEANPGCYGGARNLLNVVGGKGKCYPCLDNKKPSPVICSHRAELCYTPD